MDFDINEPNDLYHKDTETSRARAFMRGLLIAVVFCILFWSFIIYLIKRNHAEKQYEREQRGY